MVETQFTDMDNAQLAVATGMTRYKPLVTVSSENAGSADLAIPPVVMNRILSAIAVPTQDVSMHCNEKHVFLFLTESSDPYNNWDVDQSARSGIRR